MARDRKNNRIPNGLSFLMWPALVRAPWLLPSFMGNEKHKHQQQNKDHRRKHDR